ncbi:hypothetical protein BBK36DRAFT_1192374 [Trichoderma citrinoviride]|uniref:CST complex subunit STN1 n=1 Tax=Trichoderma citrinoviride TaxID=58853 RepID=A0A2T4BHV2_9HYPO|nr:hypothetical protein BBK36DRAFT_1192374 [Trichoderma citrinoviride]PTB68904.1 hypothetical protein BBK36DRAFT_1192374 [Trichoderma citrinoviride]
MTEATKAVGATSTLYPRYCFHLSPTVNTWCLLRAAEVHALDQHAGFEGECFFFYRNLPIKWVRVVGIVVAIEQYAQRRIYAIDDSSGMNISAVVTLPAPAKAKNESTTAGERPTNNDAQTTDAQVPDPYADIDVGMVVDVKGGVSSFRGERQMNVVKMVIVKGTAQEVALWEKRAKFRREVLDVPWVLREKDVRRCRREAERSEAEARAEQKRAEQKKAKKYNMDKDKDKSKSKDDAAKRVQRMLREGASSGRFSALGL